MKDIKVYAVKRKDYWNPSSIEGSGTLYADIDRRFDFLTITYLEDNAEMKGGE